jgi:WS/DGAT/MGAT family acyltransferase
VGAPKDGSIEAVYALAAAMAMGSFDRSRPLWEFTVVEGLEGGRAAVIQKLHHAVTDGVGGMLLMARVYDREAECAPQCAVDLDLPREVEPGRIGLIAEALGRRLRERPERVMQRASALLGALRRPLHSAQTLARALERMIPKLEPLSPIMRERSSRYRYHALEFRIEDLRCAGKSLGCSVSAAFLAGLTGGMRIYHSQHGAPVSRLRATVPVNLRGLDGDAVSGNELALARVELPVKEADPRKRMIEIRDLLRQQSRLPLRESMDWMAWLGNRVPTALRQPLVGLLSSGYDLVASSIAGLPEPLYMAGARVSRFSMFGPTAGTAVNATLFSYGSVADIALNIDPAAIPDTGAFRECIAEGFDEVLKLS